MPIFNQLPPCLLYRLPINDVTTLLFIIIPRKKTILPPIFKLLKPVISIINYKCIGRRAIMPDALLQFQLLNANKITCYAKVFI